MRERDEIPTMRHAPRDTRLRNRWCICLVGRALRCVLHESAYTLLCRVQAHMSVFYFIFLFPRFPFCVLSLSLFSRSLSIYLYLLPCLYTLFVSLVFLACQRLGQNPHSSSVHYFFLFSRSLSVSLTLSLSFSLSLSFIFSLFSFLLSFFLSFVSFFFLPLILPNSFYLFS